MQPSAMFRTFWTFFELDAVQACIWQTALGQATGREARSWGQAVQAFDLEPPHGPAKLAAVEPFFRQVSPPARVMAVLEALVDEGVLSRRDASRIENRLLVQVTREGHWKLDGVHK